MYDLPNGFHMASALDEAPPAVPHDFRFKPFVAMVSNLAGAVATRAISSGTMNQDGSLLGCDALIAKPLTLDAMRVLLEGCEV